MGLWDKLVGELVDIVQWLDDGHETLLYRFERYGNEIKYGAKLVVRESQVAVFVNEGQFADVFGPGTYELTTRNLPVLSTLQGWHHGFESPFKAEVYFASTKRFVDLKWGTRNPLTLRDADFGMVRLRAYGTYAVRIADPLAVIKEVAGTDGHFTVDEISDQLRNLIVSRFASAVGESDIPLLDLAGNYDRMAEVVAGRIGPEFGAYGLELTKLLIENVSLPPEVEKALDRRSSIGITGNLDDFTRYQTAEAIGAAAQVPGGAAGDAMGMGMGFAMATQMAQAFQPNAQSDTGRQNPPAAPAAGPTPPPLPGAKPYWAAIGGKQAGPFTPDQLKPMAGAGQLTRETLVWAEGMAGWTAAGEVADLAPLFVSMPPPLPK